jgi:chromosome segregation ATPase
MTFEEAKKILESEGFVVERFLGVLIEDVKAALWEKIEVGEAMKVVAENGYFPFMEKSKYEERKARLKKEYEKNTKYPGPGEEQSKKGDLKAATKMFGAQAREIMRLKAENAELRETIDKMKEGNPALAESASQFNDALLDEQAKKIAELTKDKELMKKATLSQLDDFIEIYNLLTKESQKTKRLGKEIAKLNGIIHDKNSILSDVAEELRLSKIREKNLTEVCQKYVKEVEDLRKQLANKVVDKIDAQALKSAESALAYKEKVIDKLTKENNDYKKCVEEFRNKIADMTIGKIDIQNIRLKEKNKEIKELNDKLKSINKNRHNELAEKDEVIADLGKELAEAKKQNTAVIVDMTAKCFRDVRESINDVFESYAAKYAKSSLDDLKEKAYELFNTKAHNLGLVGNKDGNGIIDQMVGADIAEKGADHSGVTVLCGKDCIDDIIKKMK